MLYSENPSLQDEKENAVLPDFSVPAVSGQTISVVRDKPRAQAITQAVKMLGGIERFVKKGDKVLLKPNAGFASPAMLGATAHPESVEAVVKLCYQAGASKVYITDNPINAPSSCFAISGIEKAAKKTNAHIIFPRDKFFSQTTLTDGILIRDWPVLYEPLRMCDKLIGICPVKHHHRSGATMTMKNWYGLLGGRRNLFHQNINTIISELASLIKPTFVILDGTSTMMSNGPTGGSLSDLKQTDTVIAGCDMVAVDTIGAELLGLKPADLPYLAKAEKAGAGTTDYESLRPKYS
jgi:uncharacterized protein (DUF362 family)